ncbi:MAG: hypothetical protein ACK5L3_14050, partial [Oscillospiraceae bacterium]
ASQLRFCLPCHCAIPHSLFHTFISVQYIAGFSSNPSGHRVATSNKVSMKNIKQRAYLISQIGPLFYWAKA